MISPICFSKLTGGLLLIIYQVVNEDPMPNIPDGLPADCRVVKSEWFWKSMENEVCPDVKDYLLQNVSIFYSPRLYLPKQVLRVVNFKSESFSTSVTVLNHVSIVSPVI